MSRRKMLVLALALMISGGGLRAQKILVGADFETRFDNREYANNDFNESGRSSAPDSRPVSASNGRRRTISSSGSKCSRTSGSTTPRETPS